MAETTPVERCRKPRGFGHRHRLAILGFSGFALSYAMRFSLSIAIVAMVDRSLLNSSKEATKSSIFKNDVCPHDNTSHESVDSKLNLYHVETIVNNWTGDGTVSDGNSVAKSGANSFEVRNDITIAKNGLLSPPSLFLNGSNGNGNPFSTIPHVSRSVNYQQDELKERGEFPWSEVDQGVILGSFYWGYVLTQCLGGWISQRIGGKWPFGVGILITGVFSILTPIATRLGGMNWLIFVRVVQGLAGGVTVPSMQSILSEWFPPEERGKLGSFTLAGMPFGTSMSMLCSGYLIHYFHWPSVFYVSGVMAVLWFLLWSYLAYSSPFDDLSIAHAEMHYIQTSLHKSKVRKQKSKENLKVPWCRVLLSPPFWAILVCNTCETWGLYTINSELPTYMKTVLRFDIKQNSVVSAFPHLLTLLVSIILTNLGDNLIERRYMSIGTIRKVSTSIALWGSAASLIGVAYSGCDRIKTVALLAAAIAFNGGKFGGFLVNIIDLAPNYAGILMGIINTIASLPGFFGPWVAGMIINDNPSLENWRLVFLITAAVAFAGNLFYVLFASGEEQSWNSINSGDDHNIDNDAGESGSGSGSTAGKTFPRNSHTLPTESINQAVIPNKVTKNNREEAIIGVFILPLNPTHASNDHEDNNHQQQAMPLQQLDDPPLLAAPAIDNYHGEGRGQLQQDAKSELWSCA